MKNKKSSKKSNKYHLLVYVKDCETKLKKFDSEQEMGKFMDQFCKDHPNFLDLDSDNWLDYCIVGITGDVHFFTDGLSVE